SALLATTSLLVRAPAGGAGESGSARAIATFGARIGAGVLISASPAGPSGVAANACGAGVAGSSTGVRGASFAGATGEAGVAAAVASSAKAVIAVAPGADTRARSWRTSSGYDAVCRIRPNWAR